MEHSTVLNNSSSELAYPNSLAIERIVQQMLFLLFPQFQHASQSPEDQKRNIDNALEEVRSLLLAQVGRVKQHCEPKVHATQINLDAMIDDVRSAVERDLTFAYENDPAVSSVAEIVLAYPSYVAVSTYRFAHTIHQLGIPLIPRMMTEYAHRQTGIDIHPGATIGTPFFIDHGTGVVIGETTNIGNNVVLYQGVTLGAYNFDRDESGALVRGTKRHPTIENDVTIYANATVLGGETVIGKHSIIGSGVWLTKSVDPHSIVTMKPPELRVRQQRK